MGFEYQFSETIMINALILAALVKVNLECKSPWVATGLLGGLGFVLSIALGYPILAVLIGTAINVGLGFLYFRALKQVEGSPAWWWIMLVGIFFFLALGML